MEVRLTWEEMAATGAIEEFVVDFLVLVLEFRWAGKQLSDQTSWARVASIRILTCRNFHSGFLLRQFSHPYEAGTDKDQGSRLGNSCFARTLIARNLRQRLEGSSAKKPNAG